MVELFEIDGTTLSFMNFTLAGAAGDAEASAFGAAAASAFALAAASAFGAASLGVALACILQLAAAQAPFVQVETSNNPGSFLWKLEGYVSLSSSSITKISYWTDWECLSTSNRLLFSRSRKSLSTIASG